MRSGENQILDGNANINREPPLRRLLSLRLILCGGLAVFIFKIWSFSQFLLGWNILCHRLQGSRTGSLHPIFNVAKISDVAVKAIYLRLVVHLENWFTGDWVIRVRGGLNWRKKSLQLWRRLMPQSAIWNSKAERQQALLSKAPSFAWPLPSLKKASTYGCRPYWYHRIWTLNTLRLRKKSFMNIIHKRTA